MKNNKDDLIFMVEDNETYSLMFDYLLTKYTNCNVKRFTSGEECIEHLKMNPQLVVLDYFLPQMNGLELLKKIKEYNPEIAVVVLTQQNDENVAKQLIDAGVDKYFHKGEDSFEKVCKAIDYQLLMLRVKKSNRERVRQTRIIGAILIASFLGIMIFYFIVKNLIS